MTRSGAASTARWRCSIGSANSRDAVRLDDDLWVTTNSDGLLLADGIAAEEALPHLILNLRRERRPRLSVDRKKAIAWSRQWVGETLRSQWSKLVDWSPDFTTLWWLDVAYPDVALRLTEALVQRGTAHRLPYGESPVRLDDVGCCAGDARLFEWLAEWPAAYRRSGRVGIPESTDRWISSLPFPREGALGFAAQRLELWTRGGVQIPSAALQAVRIDMHGQVPPLATVARCIPQAGDWFVLTQTQGGKYPAGLGPLLAAVLEEEDADLFATARRLGLLPAACSDDIIAGLAIDEVDACILSRDGDGQDPWIDRKVPRSHIGHVAREQNLDEQDLVRRVQRMAPLGVELLEKGKLQVL
ncbi:MAG TPA: hypothetical protein VF516_05430 [Kofleriaceae bacterium]